MAFDVCAGFRSVHHVNNEWSSVSRYFTYKMLAKYAEPSFDGSAIEVVEAMHGERLFIQ
jgi:hypothetical protein